MNTPAAARIINTAIRLQASRTLKRDVMGLDKTQEGLDFAKAIAEGAATGMTPQEVVGEVLKAMGGNQGMALDILPSVEELAKAHVEQHTRTLANGKTVNVKAYENARTASMKGTTLAHGATFRAMKDKSPEAHENAARMHEEAAKQHGEAHELHPMDVPEVGKEHASLKGQHQMAAEYHKGEAATMRNGEEYQRAKGKADVATNLSTHAGTGSQAAPRHMEAAALHQKAHELNPKGGHDAQAKRHEALAAAHNALDQSLESPHRNKGRYDAQDASAKALHATQMAHTEGATHEAHWKAMEAHGRAAEAHLAMHGAHESDEDGHHGKIAREHMMAHAYHDKRSRPNENEAMVADLKKQMAIKQPVAKAEGCMTSTPTTTDLAEKKGGESLAVEGRPDEDEDEDAKGASMTGTIGKAEVAAHTRTVNGRVEQVRAYSSARQASVDAVNNHGDGPRSKHSIGAGAAAHRMAAKAHENAAVIAKEAGSNHHLVHTRLAKYHTQAAEAFKKSDHESAKKAVGKITGDVNHPALKAAMEEDVTKAQVAAHTREVGGKVVQVSAYDNHYVSSGKASSTAHAATAAAKNPQGHATAAASHMQAAAGHREAAKYAPEDWQKKGHEDNAKLHEHYAQAHHAKAKAADLRADTGVDTPKHTAQDIKELENHEHYQGFGYHGHSDRTEITDEQVAEAANRANLDKHELAAHLLSKSGRHMMDGHDGGTDHETAIAHFQRHISSAKNAKEYGIKEYAKELEGMAPKAEPKKPEKPYQKEGTKARMHREQQEELQAQADLNHQAKTKKVHAATVNPPKKAAGGIDHLAIAKKHMGQDLETLDERKSDRLDFHDISKTAASRMVADAFKQGSGGKEPTEEQIHAAYKEATTHEGASHGFDHLKDEGRDHLDFKEHHVSAIKRMIETGHKHGKAAK